ncbi:MAG: tetratricopeptide repeat protein [Planctomycetes bacterium]|nr:tetratricopeptide repeat protein [Phycisphaerae bacterium]NBB95024.1 tetratricopeptide repeat protein [Planctomycetota bacterium]
MNRSQHAEFVQTLDGARQLLRLGRLEEAEPLLRGALEVRPDSADAKQLLGLVLSRQGRHEQAAEWIRSAIDDVGGEPALWGNLGGALLESRRADAAASAFQRSLAVRPDHAPTLANLSAAFRQAGQCDEAIVAAARAIELAAGSAGAWNQLGLAMRAAGRHEDAMLAFNRSLELRDDVPGVWSNLAGSLVDLGRFDDAVTAARMGATRGGGDPAALQQCAAVLIRAGRASEAIGVLDGVLEVQPENIAAHVNRGSACMDQARFDDALVSYRRAIELGTTADDAHTGEARSSTALVLLLQGKFDEGWALYEHRWSRPGASPRRPYEDAYVQWSGETLAGRRLLVWGEQGIGDEIMFAGLLGPLRQQGKVIVECDERLVPLLERSMPDVFVLSRRNPPLPAIKRIGVHAQIAMGSLPLHLRPESWSPRSAYLQADAAEVARLRETYGRDRILVGISWHSGNVQEGPKRSLPLAEWGGILAVTGVRFVSLQYGQHSDGSGDLGRQFDGASGRCARSGDVDAAGGRAGLAVGGGRRADLLV